MEDQNIPIDINSSKLLSWLISRRHCNYQWQTLLFVIREKIQSASQKLPANEEIAQLLSGTHINYFHCKKILEILIKTEAGSKNLFGNYGSQRTKDWQEIIRLYEKDNLYLAEAAQMLIRNITYEIPNLKKQIQKLEQSDHELQRKSVEYKKSENIARLEFSSMCENLKIKGSSIRQELLELTKELPAIYKEEVSKSQNLREVVEFYEAFIHFILGRYHDNGCVPTIQYIINNGNTPTTNQWVHGEDISKTAKPMNNITINESSNSQQILVIDGNDSTSSNEEISSWKSKEIDWDSVPNLIQNNEEDTDINLSFSENSTTVVENESVTILDDPTIRANLINDLLELDAFFRMRFHELHDENKRNLLSISQMQKIPPILQLSTAEYMQKMMDAVKNILSSMLDSRVKHLHYLKHSPRYIDVLTETLQQKQEVIEKMKSVQNNINIKRDELSKQMSSSYAILKLLINVTKELQVKIEQDLSKKYHNRVVRLTGIINNI